MTGTKYTPIDMSPNAVAQLVRRKREGLLSSLQNPHPDVTELIEMGLADWNSTQSLPRARAG